MTKQRLAAACIVVISILLFSVQSANAADKDFSGRWETTYGIMTLVQVGDSVSGRYVMEGYPGSLEGKVQNRRFHFKYEDFHFNSSKPKSSGEGWFELDSSGDSFAGLWRKDGESTWRVWNGTRNPAPPSAVFGFDVRFTSGKRALAIPFEADHNHIRLRVSVNGSPPVLFILDTGSPPNYPQLGLRNAESLGMTFQPLGMKGGGVGTEFSDAYIVKDTTSFSLPGVMLVSQWVLVVSLDKANECIGPVTNNGIDRNVSSSQKAKERSKNDQTRDHRNDPPCRLRGCGKGYRL